MSEFIPDEFAVFSEQQTLLSVDSSIIEDYAPLNSLDNANSLEFLSMGYNDKFKDLSQVFLNLKLKIIKQNGTDYTKTETDEKQPHLVSNALHSIFKSAFITLNGNNLRNCEGNYHYKEFLETTLNYSTETAKTRLISQLYDVESNAETLKKITKDGQIFDLHGRINLMNLDKLLIPGVSFKIRFNMENPDFYFMENTAAAGTNNISQLKLLSARLFIRHVIPRQGLLLSMERMLSSGKNACYQYKHTEIVVNTLPSNITSLSIPNFYHGPRPSLVALAFVSNSAYTGDRLKDPFVFKHFDLTRFNFTVNGNARPVNPYELKISEKENTFNHVFSRIYENLNLHNSDKSICITPETFKTTKFIVLEDLTSYGIGLDDISEPLESCSIGVNGTFSTPLPEAVSVIMYMLLPSRFEITANRAVNLIY